MAAQLTTARMTAKVVVNLIPIAPKQCSFLGNPKDSLPDQGSVVLIFVSRRAMAEFDIYDTRPVILVAPRNLAFARGIVGRQQDVYLRINPIMIVVSSSR
jgi:hypothetical protein